MASVPPLFEPDHNSSHASAQAYNEATSTTPAPPAIVNTAAWQRFRNIAKSNGLDPDNLWIGGYVNYEWHHGRYLYEAYLHTFKDRPMLEFGSNVGASGIVLAHLGAQVSGVDIDPAITEMAQAHADAYGLTERMRLHCLPDTRNLPFADGQFQVVIANSVFEYVHHSELPAILKEIRRVLAPDGIVLVLGTSNRLWPYEVHGRTWWANYLPRALDRLLGIKRVQRGVTPFTVKRGLGPCELIDIKEGVEPYLEAKASMGISRSTLAIMRVVAKILHPLGLTIGMFTPSFSMALRMR